MEIDKYCSESLMNANAIVKFLVEAIKSKKPIAISRMGDSELAVLVQDVPDVYKWTCGGWVILAGIQLPNLEAKKRLIDAYRNTDILGIFAKEPDTDKDIYSKNRYERYKVIMKFFDDYKLYPDKVWFSSDGRKVINNKQFHKLIKKYPPILIGNMIDFFGKSIEKHLGVKIPVVIPCKDYFAIDEVVETAVKYKDSRWAIISAGVPAKIIASELKLKGISAIEVGKCVNKFGGHINSKAHQPNSFYPWQEDLS